MRPPLRYPGGKWRLAPWIISHFPEHRTYVEPYGGGASVLLRKTRSYAEVYNDLDGEIVHLFRVLRDHPGELAARIRLTPYARAEFDLSYVSTEDPIEQARRTMLRSRAGFGSWGVTGASTGFRADSRRSGTTPAQDWGSHWRYVEAWAERLAGVIIECRDALELMAYYDGPDVLHYVDPPYLAATRNIHIKGYRHEFVEEDHRQLAEFAATLDGAVIVSGYPSELYDELYEGWARATKATRADGASARTECLWISPGTAALPELGLEVFA